MDVSHLVFLDSVAARKLAVAWQLLHDDRTDEAWMRLAGVTHLEFARTARSLRASNICRDDGSTDEIAIKYIAGIAVAEARKANRK